MDTKKKEEILRGLPDEYKGTRTERVFLEMSDENYVPMWVSALKPVKQTLKEHTAPLRKKPDVRHASAK
ncbi:MAG: hypothetical protein LBL54_04630 [Clostridiales Family XIII bacterium]|jgi:hypothetical protein|nr:hypothetical protein [Clostridiales Family XIII bacterium]